MDKLEHYLDQVCRGIGGPRSLRQHVRQELREHLLDAADQYKAAGLPEAQALDRALEDFGGTEEVRSGLEATHGHRLLPVVIDKAMQWKERTMRAKWLWTTWAYLVVAGVVVLELLFLPFTARYQVPKLQKITSDGWLQFDASEGLVSWMYSILHGVQRACDTMIWWLAALAAGWGLFEWRVRSENKPFMRLAALGTAALGLAVVVVITEMSLVIPFTLGLPGTRIARPWAVEAVTSIDTSVKALEQALVQKDWEAMRERADRAAQGLSRLEAGPSLAALTVRNEPPTVPELWARLTLAKECLREAEQAIRGKDAERLKAALQRFHEQYGPIEEAAARSAR